MLDQYFKVSERGSTVSRELLAGLVTFMTMAYIIFVNPQILGAAGMEAAPAVTATCFAAALGTLVMGLWANYPFALAPGMGLNAIFTFWICGQLGFEWPVALGMVFISGVLFLALTIMRVRQVILRAIPRSLQLAIAAGIGLFIAFIGLQHAGLVVNDDATLVKLGNPVEWKCGVFFFGLLVTGILLALRVRGAILIGLVGSAFLAYSLGLIRLPDDAAWRAIQGPDFSTFLALDIRGALRFDVKHLLPILILLFFDLFDTLGTLVGVGEQGGFIKDGRLPRAHEALFADAAATVCGSLFGTSTVTTYIESSAGVAEGGRTGLANMVTAGFFILAALLFSPLIVLVGQETAVTAPALVVVGFLIMSGVGKINWSDVTEGLPAFLTIALMPLTFSISHGLVAGFVTYAALKLGTGRWREAHWLVYVIAAALVLCYAFALPQLIAPPAPAATPIPTPVP